MIQSHTYELESNKTNWFMLVLIALIPLQNIYLQKVPSLGGGLNLLNLMMVLSFISSLRFKETSFSSEFSIYVNLILFFYIYSIIISILNNIDQSSELMLILKNVITPIPIFYIVYKSCTNIEDMKKIFWSMIIPLPYMFYVFKYNLSWMQFSSYNDKLRFNGGTFSAAGLGSNEIAAFYVYYTLIILSFAFYEKRRLHKMFLFIAVSLNFFCIIYGLSRGAYLSIILGIAIYAWLVGRLKLVIIAAIIFSILISFDANILPNAVTERFQSTFVSETERDESVQLRIILWDIAVNEFLSNPLTGVGFTSFKNVNEYHMDTHNFYLKVLVETGIIGLGLFSSFLVACFKISFKLYKEATDPFLKALATGFIPCLFALLLSNLFGDRFSHYQLISYFFVYLAMVVRGVEWSSTKSEISLMSS